MWTIVKQSDRETMIDELQRLKPLANDADESQKARAVAFVIAELQAAAQDQCSLNMSGSRVGDNNYLSIIMGLKRSPSWQLNKSNLPRGMSRQELVAFLGTFQPTSEQQSRAVNFAAAELSASTEKIGSININGDPDTGFLSLSVSAAE